MKLPKSVLLLLIATGRLRLLSLFIHWSNYTISLIIKHSTLQRYENKIRSDVYNLAGSSLVPVCV